MYKVDIKKGGHTWEKQNLVTVTKAGGSYDEMRCSNCGIKGRRYDLANVSVSENYSMSKVYNCPKQKEQPLPVRIRITDCRANGKIFSNLIPGSEHDVVSAPKGQNNNGGVWVMGVGEPVKVLDNEFESVNPCK